MSLHTKETPYKCAVCSKRYYSIWQLSAHMRTGGSGDKSRREHGLEPGSTKVSCPKCFIILEKISLRAHLKIHDDPNKGRYQCSICFGLYSSNSTLRRHKKYHDVSHKKFSCGDCDKTFFRQEDLDYHKKMSHLTPKLRIPCPKCGVSTLVHGYNKHMRESHEPPKYTCYFCLKPFATVSSLNNHLLGLHLNEKCMKCDMCSYRTCVRGRLNYHVTVHHDEPERRMKYPCYFCEKAFLRLPSYYGHMNLHLLEKWFVCGGCGQRFSSSGKLCRHVIARNCV